MVARSRGPQTAAGETVLDLFRAWRHLLSAAFTRRPADSEPLQDSDMVQARAQVAGSGLSGQRALLAGFTAVLIGGVVAVAVAAGVRERLGEAAAVAAAALWAFGRWFLMRRSASDADRQRVDAAAGWGLLPWLVAWSPGLRLGAWFVSAVLTWYLLERSGGDRRAALRLVGIAWGAHAAFVVAATIANSVLVIALGR